MISNKDFSKFSCSTTEPLTYVLNLDLHKVEEMK